MLLNVASIHLQYAYEYVEYDAVDVYITLFYAALLFILYSIADKPFLFSFFTFFLTFGFLLRSI